MRPNLYDWSATYQDNIKIFKMTKHMYINVHSDHLVNWSLKLVPKINHNCLTKFSICQPYWVLCILIQYFWHCYLGIGRHDMMNLQVFLKTFLLNTPKKELINSDWFIRESGSTTSRIWSKLWFAVRRKKKDLTRHNRYEDRCPVLAQNSVR